MRILKADLVGSFAAAPPPASPVTSPAGQIQSDIFQPVFERFKQRWVDASSRQDRFAALKQFQVDCHQAGLELPSKQGRTQDAKEHVQEGISPVSDPAGSMQKLMTRISSNRTRDAHDDHQMKEVLDRISSALVSSAQRRNSASGTDRSRSREAQLPQLLQRLLSLQTEWVLVD
jgi:hypothetical protein